MSRRGRYTGPTPSHSLDFHENLSNCWPPFRSKARVLADGRVRWSQRESPVMTWWSMALGIGLGAAATAFIATTRPWTGSDILDLVVYVVAIVLLMVLITPTRHLEFDPAGLELTTGRCPPVGRRARARLRDAELGLHPVELRTPRRGVVDWTWHGHALILWLPEGQRYVFGCFPSLDDARAYADALPEPFKAAMSREHDESEADQAVSAMYAWFW